jgi:hypothetical protein
MTHTLHLGRRPGHLMPWTLIGVGLALAASAGVWQLRESLWMSNYHRVGTALTRQEESRIAAAQQAGTAAGTAGSSSSTSGGSTTPPSLDSASKGSNLASSSCPAQPSSGPQGLFFRTT